MNLALKTRNLAFCAAIAAAAFASAGSATTLSNTEWLVPPHNAAEGYTVNRGAVSQSVSTGGFDGDFGATHIEFWCFDLDHTFSLNTPYSYIATSFTGALATRVAQLFEAGANRGSDLDHSAGFQLALWNIEYDNDLTVSSGSFFATGGAGAIGIANAYLADLANHTGSSVTLSLLTSTGTDTRHQGFITPNTVPLTLVPEPPAMPLVLTALGALVLVETRRRMRARGG